MSDLSEEKDSSIRFQNLTDETDEQLIRLIQDGIALTHSPFASCAEELGISEDDVIARLKNLKAQRKIRRFGASIGHIALGFTANGMGVWDVAPEKIDEVGRKMAAFDEVSHCYERPRSAEWPYNMYTMIHGRSQEECYAAALKISRDVGISEYKLVFSESELKKKGVRI